MDAVYNMWKQDGPPNQKNLDPVEVTLKLKTALVSTDKHTKWLFYCFSLQLLPNRHVRPPLINSIQKTKAFPFKALQLEHFVINDPLLG